MLFAVITFIVGSAGCGAAPTFWTLVAFRAIAGIGAAGLIGLTFIIIAGKIFFYIEFFFYFLLINLSFLTQIHFFLLGFF